MTTSQVPLNEVRYYTDDDVYHYTVDNRPLQDLASNDTILQTAIQDISDTLNTGLQTVTLKAGTNFTAGTSLSITVPGISANSAATWIFFNSGYQSSSSYSVSTNTVTFTSVIPIGTNTIEVKWSNIGLVNAPLEIQVPVTINTRDGLGRVLTYTEGSDLYVITYNANGTVNTLVGGGSTQTMNYDSQGNLLGISVS